MFLNKDRQKFVRAVGIMIILQGLVWFSLSIAGIVVKQSPPNSVKSSSFSSYSNYLSRIIYEYFMVRDDKVIRPPDFQAFMWIYAVLSAIWVATSLDQNMAIRYQKLRQSYITLVLGVAILITSVIDLVFFSLLARDFSNCPFNIGEASSEAITTLSSAATTTTVTTTTTITTIAASTTDTITAASENLKSLSQVLSERSMTTWAQVDCKLAYGIVMSLAARGYVLWVINVVLGINLISIGAKAMRTPTLLTYGNNTIPRVRIPDSRKAPSPDNDLVFFGDKDNFAPPAPPISDHRNRNGTPVALNNKNQSIYY